MTTEKELYLVPVPLSDETSPADVLPQKVIDIVRDLRCFFVENLRSARRFLRSVDSKFDIDGSEFYTVDEHTTRAAIEELREPLLKAGRVAMISEAGCPVVADPGSMIVELARRNGFRIIPLTGPSSIILGLMASGFNGQNFTFHGYLPHDAERRHRKLKEMAKNILLDNSTQIFIETPYRNNKLLEELAVRLPGEIRICVACNLTAPDEEIVVKKASEWKKGTPDFSRRPAIFLLSN